jgi:UDP:flavonoid glycosyltransferase YjiC (YdhE family)
MERNIVHITIITLGSRGDVHPYVALGAGLQRAGHSVQIVTHAPFAELVHQHKMTFSPLDTGKQELFQTVAGQRLLNADGLRLLQRFAQNTRPLIAPTLIRCWQACQGTDAIIASLQGLPYGLSIAEKRHLPLVVACVQPNQLPTRAFADPGFAHTFRPRGQSHSLLNYVSHMLAHAAFWEIFLPEMNRVRRRFLNLPPLPVETPWRSLSEQADLLLIGYSPSVIPKPPEWNERAIVTGYWFLDAPACWQPPDDLVSFLRAGPPPIYVGFGSMSDAHPERLTHLVRDALERCHQRGILLTGWGALQQELPSSRVYCVASVPHDWLFPQVAAVVSHGGAGTIGASLRAGVPPITVSFLPEQAFWGTQVLRLGAGPHPITSRTLTAPRLARAIEQAVQNIPMRQRAEQLGQQIRSEDGVARAVESFERVIVQQSGRKRYHRSFLLRSRNWTA